LHHALGVAVSDRRLHLPSPPRYQSRNFIRGALLSLAVDWWAAAPQVCGVYTRYGSKRCAVIAVHTRKMSLWTAACEICDLRESTAMEALKQNLSGESGQLHKYLIGLPRLENNLTSSVNFREALPRLLGASFTGPERYEGILRQRMYERMAHDAYLAILP
jgi:hypothetical protein